MRHPAGCVPSPYLTGHCHQSCHARSGRGGRRCACAVDSCKRLGLPSRARISHGLHHGICLALARKNVAGLTSAMMSQRHRSFPESPDKTGSRESKEQWEMRSVGQRRGRSSLPRKMCGRGSARPNRGQATRRPPLACIPAPTLAARANRSHHHLDDRDPIARLRAPIR